MEDFSTEFTHIEAIAESSLEELIQFAKSKGNDFDLKDLFKEESIRKHYNLDTWWNESI